MARSSAETPTKDRILAAAMQVFAAKGYHGAVVDDIVDASATSKGAFYHYFASKQDIFLTLMDSLATLVEQGAETAIASQQGALAKIEAALRVVLETAAEQRDLAKILLVEAVGLGPGLETKRLEIHRRFAAVIKRHLDGAVTDGSIPAQDTLLTSVAWIGAINEVVSLWLITEERPLLDYLPGLRALLLRSIGASQTNGNAGTRHVRMDEFTVEQILDAVRKHLAARHVATLATSYRDEPWAATAFYVPRGVDLVVCQGKRARTLAHMMENPRTAFAVDDRKAEVWLQGIGTAGLLSGDEDAQARVALQNVAPEFIRHFTNPEYPTLIIRVDELTFADRPQGIYPRQHLVLRDGVWRFAG